MRTTILPTGATAFLAGALGVVLFHQAFVLVLYLFRVIPFAPYSLRATSPFNIPQLLSQSFWGGLWGICMIFAMDRIGGANRLWVAFLFGGIALPLVAALIVTPLKGGSMADWLAPQRLLVAFAVNGVWGLGTAVLYRIAWQRRPSV
jgi:hypothetical protein